MRKQARPVRAPLSGPDSGKTSGQQLPPSPAAQPRSPAVHLRTGASDMRLEKRTAYPDGASDHRTPCSFIRSHRSCLTAGIAVLLSLIAVGLVLEERKQVSINVDALRSDLDKISKLFTTLSGPPALERGAIGPAGPPAERGAIGPACPPEERGAIGPAGPPAEWGAIGPAGPPAEWGAIGPAGPPAEWGAIGPAGPPEERGAVGLAGPVTVGPPGPPGEKGIMGTPSLAVGPTRPPVRPQTSRQRMPNKEEQCQSGWVGYNVHCYKFKRQELTWNDALTECGKEGANVASIANRGENYFIAGLSLNAPRAVWIGLRRRGDSWIWTDGSPRRYANWRPGEPNNFKTIFSGGEHCVSMYSKDGRYLVGTWKTGEWNDVRCRNKYPFICKKLKSWY
ncbi:PREDICTED: collectin-12-like [Branchiostoma belcheri]|uniref:Collectin-12-like n=1 Tax=Branchiostoma belcheri TaxID=7741 RepID=A0A6P5AED4_BRABE|nr:PREDICTED: collectin-12-like [Branchiostoma belcheri]